MKYVVIQIIQLRFAFLALLGAGLPLLGYAQEPEPNLVVHLGPAVEGEDALERITGALQQAGEMAREARQSGAETGTVRVQLASGLYRLRQPITITPELIGLPEGWWLEVVGDATGTTRITGAWRATFEREAEDAWSCSLPVGVDVPWSLRSPAGLLFPARHPNGQVCGDQWLRLESSFPDGRTGFVVPQAALPPDGPLEHLAVDYLHDWNSSYSHVAEVDRETRSITLTAPLGDRGDHYRICHYEPHPRFAYVGAWALADQEGEWAPRGNAAETRLWLRASEAPQHIELPAARELIVLEGTADQPLTRVRLAHLQLDGTAIPQEPGGLHACQAGLYEARLPNGDFPPQDADNTLVDYGPRGRVRRLPAAVRMTYCHDVQATNLHITDCGGAGLTVETGCHDITLQSLSVSNTGSNGLEVSHFGHATGPVGPSRYPEAIVIRGCRVSAAGRVAHGAVGIWIALARGCTVEHCTVSDTPYTGVSVGWRWNPTFNNTGGHRFAANHVYRVMQLLSDGGGFYTLGCQRLDDGRVTVFENNVVHDIGRAHGRAPSNAWFFDQGSSSIYLKGGAAWGIGQTPLRFHQAEEVHVEGMLLEPSPNTPSAQAGGLFQDNRSAPDAIHLAEGQAMTEEQAQDVRRDGVSALPADLQGAGVGRR